LIKIVKILKKAYFWAVRKKWLKPAISRGPENTSKTQFLDHFYTNNIIFIKIVLLKTKKYRKTHILATRQNREKRAIFKTPKTDPANLPC
jgi:hypothetical protein